MGSAPSVGRLFSPLDEELRLLPGKLTPLLHERLVQAATVGRSFAAGAAIFTAFTRTHASEPTARRYTERAGSAMEACVAAELPAAPPPDDPQDHRPFWVGVDGVFVRLVGGSHREVRTVSLGRVNPPKLVQGEEQVTTSELSYFSRLTDSAAEFTERSGVEFQRRRVSSAAQVGAGSDGADWCQSLLKRHCPQAKRYLDFWHAAERVQAFSKVLLPGKPHLTSWYASTQLHRLKHDGPDRLLESLAAWRSASNKAVREVASAQYAFFDSRRELLDYPGLRAAGLPIGTGNAESANLHVVQDRLKGPGKFWGEQHVNPMLALRNAWCSARWEEDWEVTSTRLARQRTPVKSVHASNAKN
jgi:hypothetical protein